MTCLVGVVDGPRVILGSDSLGSDQLAAEYGPKVFQVGPYGLGVSGDYRVLQLLEHALRPPDPPAGDGLMPFLVTTFATEVRTVLADGGWTAPTGDGAAWDGLLAVAGRLFELQAGGVVLEPVSRYAARGDGAGPALGALHVTARRPARLRVLAALQAADAHVPTVGRPFHLVTI